MARKSFGIGGIRLAYVYCLNPCLGGVLGNKYGTIYFSKIFGNPHSFANTGFTKSDYFGPRYLLLELC